MNRRRLRDLGLWLALIAVGGDAAWAFQCAVPIQDVQEVTQRKLEAASAVWIGRVQAVGEELNAPGDVWNRSIPVRFTVERLFKGRGEAEIEAVLPLQGDVTVGQRLLVFARPSTPQERLDQTRGRWASRRWMAAQQLPKDAQGRVIDGERFGALIKESAQSETLVRVADPDLPRLTAGGACEAFVFSLSRDGGDVAAARTELPHPLDRGNETMLWRLAIVPTAGTGGRLWLSLDVELAPGAPGSTVQAELQPSAGSAGAEVRLTGGTDERRFGVRWLTASQQRGALSAVSLPPGSHHLELPVLPSYELTCWRAHMKEDCQTVTVADGGVVVRKLFYKRKSGLPANGTGLTPAALAQQLDDFRRQWAQQTASWTAQRH
ncbi:hypothetical protein ACG04R_00370 [Roseateles sp. BYS78W]|uniref:DUF4131 domain-containing protein n=1 Tax=Pelomonas candidula TaxID=3299025 RepID=A0ABW7H5B7_9BURK